MSINVAPKVASSERTAQFRRNPSKSP